MSVNRKTILIICAFILAIILTAVITVVIVKSIDKNEKNKTTETSKTNGNKKDFEEEDVPIVDENITNSEEKSKTNTVNDETPKNEAAKVETSKAKNNTTNSVSEVEDNIIKSTEADVINYVEEISVTSTSDKLKNGFVTVVDFLFYGGEIKGKTFNELSASAKIKIISLALKIDSKIDEYFPGYKESISNTTNKVYTSIKTKLVTLYLDTTVKICNDNPTLCEDAKQGLTDLKQSFGLTWDFIKDISGVGITKLKDWYEVWKEE